jgi:tyrosine-specific transport protein
MNLTHRLGHVVGGTLLVSGITIGVGMLALPLATAEGGFLPAVVIYIICWLFMLATGLLTLEACIWMPKDSNFLTLANRLLGFPGKVFCLVLYLFLFICLMIAHVAGGGSVIDQITEKTFPHWINIFIYVLIFSPVVYLGTLWVDRLNLLLMLGIGISYLIFVFSAVPHLQIDYLQGGNWTRSWAALPVIFTAFGYQNIIPTLMTYLERDVRKVRLAIILGTSIPLCIYLIWELCILGIIPKESLVQAFHKGQNAVTPLGTSLKAPFLLSVGQIFAFFALSASTNGIAIAFVDFLADGLKVKKKGMAKLGLCAFVFLIPALVAIIQPDIFIKALDVAGGFGVALLLGALPVAMIWSGRYYKKYSLENQQLPGGKFLLSLLMVFVLIEIISQFL